MAHKKFDNNVFNTISGLIPYIRMLFDNEACIAITDRENFIDMMMGEHFKIPYKVGDPVNQPVMKVLTEKKMWIQDIPKNIMEKSSAIAAKCYFFPLFDQGEVIGTLTIAVHLENKYQLNEIVELLSQTTQEMTKSIKQITSGIDELNNMNNELLNKTSAAAEKTNDTDKIVSIIQNISKKTNLLGLNASIEASRSGKAGDSFAVVAREIQKLSVSSKESINQIDTIIKEIYEEVHGIDDGLGQINMVSQEQSEALKEITRTMNQINEITEKINELMKKM